MKKETKKIEIPLLREMEGNADYRVSTYLEKPAGVTMQGKFKLSEDMTKIEFDQRMRRENRNKKVCVLKHGMVMTRPNGGMVMTLNLERGDKLSDLLDDVTLGFDCASAYIAVNIMNDEIAKRENKEPAKIKNTKIKGTSPAQESTTKKPTKTEKTL